MTDADMDRVATQYEVPLWTVRAAVELGNHGDAAIRDAARVIAKHEVLARVGPVEWQDAEPIGVAE